MAWRTATARSLRGVGREERDHWHRAYLWSELYWRRAYEGIRFDRCDRPIYPY